MTVRALTQNKQHETFKVVDRILNQILGQEGAQIIYEYLENNHSMQKHEIAENLDSFNRALEEYLGSGAVVIERVIMQSLELRELQENKLI